MLSVVVPAHNEEAYLEPAVRELVDGLRSRSRPFELLVVENGSTDATASIAGRLAAEIPEMRTLSLATADYGGALRSGFLQATGELVAAFDVDFYDLDFMDRAAAQIEAPGGPDVVVGSKRAEGSVDARAWSRRLVTAVFGGILRYGFGLKVSDTHGIKVARRAPLEGIASRCRAGTDLFDTELVLRAERAGLAVAELPVTVEQRRPSRSSIATRIPRTIVGLTRMKLALRREEKG